MMHIEHIKADRLEKLLQQLIDIYSPSGKEEQILGFIYQYLRRRNLPVQKQEVDEHRYNLIVAPPETDIHLALVGHVDTVTAFDFDHYQSEMIGDTVEGLGAADMKGGCAAMIEAFVSLWEQGRSSLPVALVLVVGEEEDGDGAQVLVRDFRFDWAIVGEPTDLKPCLSCYGYLEMHLSSWGKRMHASLARWARNPVVTLLRRILELTRHIDEVHPELVYNIRDLSSTGSGFAVPEFCESWIDVHLPPTARIPDIMNEFEEILGAGGDAGPQSEFRLRFNTIAPGFELPEKGPVVDRIKRHYAKKALAWAPVPFTSHSDANQLWQSGIRPIVLGPGRLEKAHTSDESISFGQVCLAAELYHQVALTMFE
ncbi:MAG: M20 family metallopeptidase, partial [Desulfatiglandales bacterium]